MYLSCSRASDYGLMKIDNKGRIIQFAEKPKGLDLKAMVGEFTSLLLFELFSFFKVSMPNWLFSNSFVLQQVDTTILGLSEKDARNNPYIASMGVYVFKTDVLLKLLRWSYPSCNDFGSEIIPSAVREHNVQVRQKYLHDLLCVLLFNVFDLPIAI